MNRPTTEERESHESAHHSLPEAVFDAAGGGALGGLQLALMAVALGVQIAWFMRSLGNRVDVQALLQQLKKLVAADNIDRAIKLCMATPAPAARLARVGLEARKRGGSARDAMREVHVGHLSGARSGLVASMAIGVLGLAEAILLLIKGVEQNGDKFAFEFGIVPLALAAFAILNGMRWGALERELTQVEDELGRDR